MSYRVTTGGWSDLEAESRINELEAVDGADGGLQGELSTVAVPHSID